MFEALGKYVLVERVAAELKTAGGIIIPEKAAGTPEEGYILSVGSEVTSINIGDQVLVPVNAGRPAELGGRKVVILLEEEVMVRMVD